MTLTAHRPAPPLSSLQGDPTALDVSLPGLPNGVTLDLEVLRSAACAACPVKDACLEMALATGDQHAILGGTPPAERIPLRRQRQVGHARQLAAQRATATTGIDPAEVRGPAGRSMAAPLRGDASATVRAGSCARPPAPPT